MRRVGLCLWGLCLLAGCTERQQPTSTATIVRPSENDVARFKMRYPGSTLSDSLGKTNPDVRTQIVGGVR
jgi:hypothetical protein